MKEEYLKLAERNVSIFGMPWWVDILCKGKWDALVLKDTNGTLLWPFHTKKIGIWQTISIPQVTLFQGPYTIGTPNNSTWNSAFSIFNTYAEFNYQSAPNWKPNPSWDLQLLKQKQRTHYELAPKNNWRLDYNKLTQRKLKKALKDFTISEATNLDNFFKVSKLSYQSQGVNIPFSKAILMQLFTEGIKRNQTKILESYLPSGQIASVVWLVWDKEYVYYFLSGMDRSIPNNSSVVGIIDKAIAFAFESGKKFNFYGSEVPGVARFMQGFGATACHSTYFTHQKSKPLKLLRKVSKFIK